MDMKNIDKQTSGKVIQFVSNFSKSGDRLLINVPLGYMDKVKRLKNPLLVQVKEVLTEE